MSVSQVSVFHKIFIRKEAFQKPFVNEKLCTTIDGSLDLKLEDRLQHSSLVFFYTLNTQLKPEKT